jgi:diguanylate cyclase (GGDEF)-like protein
MTLPLSHGSLCVLFYGSDHEERARRHRELQGVEVLELEDRESLHHAILANQGDVLVVCDPQFPAPHLPDGRLRPPVIWIAAVSQPGIADVLLSPATEQEEFRECVQLLGRRSQALDELERLSAQVREAFNRHGWRGSRRWHGPQQLLDMVLTDPLTGAYSRRHFDDSLRQEFERADSPVQPLSLLLIDLDQFKPVNDTYGHRTGDLVLIEVAKRLRGCTRGSDIVCRYGGDEFAVISPGSSVDAALRIADRARAAVSETAYSHDTTTIRLGCSIGIASLPHPDIRSFADLALRADAALIAAKRAGGNRVCTAE